MNRWIICIADIEECVFLCLVSCRMFWGIDSMRVQNLSSKCVTLVQNWVVAENGTRKIGVRNTVGF